MTAFPMEHPEVCTIYGNTPYYEYGFKCVSNTWERVVKSVNLYDF